ncbi:High light inducible protein hli11 [Prochlorococcus marinus str. PAC1]|nr:High light inducible protein hli11 [Prochlorococcus marinus str. PAC1]
MFGCPPSTAGIPPLFFLNNYIHSQMTPEAEKFNGWAAMLGFVAAFGAYATTGQIIPGIF